MQILSGLYYRAHLLEDHTISQGLLLKQASGGSDGSVRVKIIRTLQESCLRIHHFESCAIKHYVRQTPRVQRQRLSNDWINALLTTTIKCIKIEHN